MSYIQKHLFYVFVMASVAACSGGSSDNTPAEIEEPVQTSAEPAEFNTVIRAFSKPFEGDFVNSNPFDHFYPSYPTVDDNSEFIDYRGETMPFNWDGHNGHDWVMPTGTPLLAIADGTVEFVGREPCGWVNANGDNLLMRIRHPIGDEIFDSVYVHVSEFNVAVGDTVTRGQQVALSGNTGCSTGPHLHFMMRRVTNTNNGASALIDPFGWEGEGQDPWEYHVDGAQSVWLWREGEAPRPWGYEPE